MTERKLHLYHREACPFCTKVRLALAELALGWEGTLVDPEDPSDRSTLRDVSRQELVPVLVDRSREARGSGEGDVVIHDSSRIVDHLVSTHGGDRRTNLSPSGAAGPMVWILARYFDEGLIRYTEPLDLAARGRGDLADDERDRLEAELVVRLSEVEKLLEDREFLLGPHSLADVTLYSHLRCLHDSTGAERGGPRLAAWLERMTERSGNSG